MISMAKSSDSLNLNQEKSEICAIVKYERPSTNSAFKQIEDKSFFFAEIVLTQKLLTQPSSNFKHSQSSYKAIFGKVTTLYLVLDIHMTPRPQSWALEN